MLNPPKIAQFVSYSVGNVARCSEEGVLHISIYRSIPKSPVYENDQLVAVQQSASRSNPTSDMQEENSIFGVFQWEGAS